MSSSGEIGNSEFIESLYDQYLKDPKEIDPSWRRYFQQLEATKVLPPSEVRRTASQDELRITRLIDAYRTFGHLYADVNCIALESPQLPEQLQIERFGFRSADLDRLYPTCGILSKTHASLQEIIDKLQQTYCRYISVEFQHIQNFELKEWIQHHFEIQKPSDAQHIMIFEDITKAEIFETFLHTRYTGQKRFSLEGGETLIPMLMAILDRGGDASADEIVLGMAHRGRLNVLAHILQKPYLDILNEFDEDYIPESFEGTGDVKYHKGYISESVRTHAGKPIKVTLTPNPSHLESVDPVVEGQTRAKQTAPDGKHHVDRVIPILIHGDAALSGQGVIYETLQFYRLEGYSTGGTLHLVINNQIGFTTWPRDSRSTLYCTDIAKAFDAPIFHVNAEHPEECVWAALLAFEIRDKFHCDVFIDVNCYRKYGHNETDEPAFTQPLEYQLIKEKSSIQTLYKNQLIKENRIDVAFAKEKEEAIRRKLQETYDQVHQEKKKKKYLDLMVVPDNKALFAPFPTGVSADILKTLTDRLCTIPEEFAIHPKIEKVLLQERKSMAEGKKPIDWGMAETLAYATLLFEGRPIRITGQDCCRGTFSHRHALWVDQKNESLYYPLANLGEGQGFFEIVNSTLSEMAAVGFEYGYSLGKLDGLTIWEAQFGDFCNGAQVIIDQFIASAEQKWGQKSNLTLYLPHGYEGQGPEHSSARMERFLSLAGHDNMVIVNPTTPAQLFHLLRRQTLRPLHKPLIVFTPKGLLRHSQCVNELKDLTKGYFEEIIDENIKPAIVKKLILCSGRIYYDLIQERSKRNISDAAIIRIEQLYPLDEKKLKTAIDKYKKCECYIWVQEEPKNMGAWKFIRPYLEDLMPKGIPLTYAGRIISASTATGSHAQHLKEHKEILMQVFQL